MGTALPSTLPTAGRCCQAWADVLPVDLAQCRCRQCWLMLGRQTCAGIDQRWPIMVKGICASSGSPSWLYVWANRKYRSNLKLTPAFSEVSFVFYKAVWVLMLLFRASLRPIFSPEGPGYVKVYHFRAAICTCRPSHWLTCCNHTTSTSCLQDQGLT